MTSGLGNVKRHLHDFINENQHLKTEFFNDQPLRETFPINLFYESSQSILKLATNISLKEDKPLKLSHLDQESIQDSIHGSIKCSQEGLQSPSPISKIPKMSAPDPKGLPKDSLKDLKSKPVPVISLKLHNPIVRTGKSNLNFSPPKSRNKSPLEELKLSSKKRTEVPSVKQSVETVSSQQNPLESSMQSLIQKLQREGQVSDQFATYDSQKQFQILWQKQQIEEDQEVRSSLTDAIVRISQEISRNQLKSASPVRDVYYTQKQGRQKQIQ